MQSFCLWTKHNLVKKKILFQDKSEIPTLQNMIQMNDEYGMIIINIIYYRLMINGKEKKFLNANK